MMTRFDSFRVSPRRRSHPLEGELAAGVRRCRFRGIEVAFESTATALTLFNWLAGAVPVSENDPSTCSESRCRIQILLLAPSPT